MIDGSTIVRPLLWRVVRRCSVPLVANLVLYGLFGSQPTSALVARILELRAILVAFPIVIAAWTVTRWEDDDLPYGQSVINAWSGATIALLGSALVEIMTDVVRSKDFDLASMLVGYSLFTLPFIAIATALCRTLFRRRTAVPLQDSTD